MKKILLLFSSFLIVVLLNAQVTEAEEELKKHNIDTIAGWKSGGVISVNFTQVSLTNWAAGGQSSYSANGLLSLFANYKTTSSSWDNTLDLGYGVLKQGENADWIKTDDKIDFTSKYGQKAFSKWYYAGLLNFKTQMAKGYNYPDSIYISKFLAPAYILGAIGMDHKPNDNFSLFVAPVTGKFTIVNDQTLSDSAAFGVEAGKKFRSETGGYMKIFYKKDIMENITAQTKLDLFSNYIDNPENIDVSWEVLIAMKINKYISANITTHLIYDDDIDVTDKDGNIGPRVQFKEVLGIGFSFKF